MGEKKYIELYHGSDTVVERPSCSVGRKNLDFGDGFYLTDIKSQAIEFAAKISSRNSSKPVVSVYSFERDIVLEKYNCKIFSAYDLEWMDFIVASRSGMKPYSSFDYIEGGIANDRVIDTVNLYIAGLMTPEAALGELSRHQPNNQICILNQEIVDKYLKYVRSE